MNVDQVLSELSEAALSALREDAPPKGAWELAPLEWSRFLPRQLGEELLRHDLVKLLYAVVSPKGAHYRCELTARGQAAYKAARELQEADRALGPAA